MKATTAHVLTYGDLPNDPKPRVAIFCTEGCDEGYSATYGDYFYRADDEPVVCSECGAPMFLGRAVTTIVEVDA
jgi:hypothetical protein